MGGGGGGGRDSAVLIQDLLSFLPWGLESEVMFAQDIPYKRVHEYY